MRKAQRLEREIRERWPTLRDLTDCYFYEDWQYRSKTIENVMADMTEIESIERLKAGVQDWWSANGEVAWKSDFDTLLVEEFRVNQSFDGADQARAFWNKIYDGMITGIRASEKGWKP